MPCIFEHLIWNSNKRPLMCKLTLWPVLLVYSFKTPILEITFWYFKTPIHEIGCILIFWDTNFMIGIPCSLSTYKFMKLRPSWSHKKHKIEAFWSFENKLIHSIKNWYRFTHNMLFSSTIDMLCDLSIFFICSCRKSRIMRGQWRQNYNI